jgi:hypothetical protein
MKKSELRQLIKEELTSLKPQYNFAAKALNTDIKINNSTDETFNTDVYYKLIEFIKTNNLNPKTIVLTF